MPLRIAAGATTGCMAVMLAQPTDVVKVRFQAQLRSTTGQTRYSSTMQAYRTIAMTEGAKGLWKGKQKKLSEELVSWHLTFRMAQCMIVWFYVTRI